MDRRPPQLDRFVSAVHRRLMVLRALEAAGVGLLGASAACLILLPVLFWRAQSGLWLAAGFLTIGAAAGVVWSLSRRPTALAAAIAADRQLNLHDLLSTAWTARGEDQPFASAVMALAEAHCREVSPSAVIVNRLGRRAWGGIGLATALVLTLGLISANPISSRALAGLADRMPPNSADMTWIPPENRMAFAPQVSSESVAPGRTPAQEQFVQPGDPNDASAGGSAKPGNTDHSAAGSNGVGEGMATSGGGQPNRTSLSPRAGGGADVGSGGLTASGGGETAQGGHSPGPAGTSAGMASHAAPTPPWKASDWPQVREEAARALSAGEIPDEYRDMVRAYFDER